MELPPPAMQTTGVCGTPGFMAPELLAEQPYDTRADIYSYGSLLYEITHGHFPFSQVCVVVRAKGEGCGPCPRGPHARRQSASC